MKNSHVDQFCYLGQHIIAGDCRDDEDIEKQFRKEAKCCWQYAGQEVLICTNGGKIQLFKLCATIQKLESGICDEQN